MASAETYKVPSNGCLTKVIYYAQGKSGGGGAWSDKAFGGGNITSSGCSITSLAMVLTYLLSKAITPDKVVDAIASTYGDYNHFYSPPSGQGWDIFPGVADIYGVSCKEISSSEVSSCLANGNPIIQSCSPGHFTDNGHFIVLTGFDSYGNCCVNDPSHPAFSYDKMTLQFVLNEGKGWFLLDSSGKKGGYSFPNNAYTGGAISHGALEGNVNTSSTGTSTVTSSDTDYSSMFAGGDETASKLLSGAWDIVQSNYEIQYQTVTAEIERDEIKTVDGDFENSTAATSLLSYPTLVESPFVSLKVGNYTFGVSSDMDSSGTVDFPNYITGLSVTKISGQVNQYTINMTYQVSEGDDPNLVDKIFSTVGYGKVYISYGDWNAPTFIYKEEEAIITKLKSDVDFRNSCIKYTVSCTSSALALAASYFDFEKRTAQPSSVIQEIMSDAQYGLQEMFPGNSQMNVSEWLQLSVADQSVEIEQKHGVDALSYLNYLVSCMCPAGDDPTSALKSGNYYLSIYDDSYGKEFNGTYFKIQYVEAGGDSSKVLSSSDVFEVDIGYPTDNMVTEFKITDDNSWALLYNYSENTNGTKLANKYTYSIDNSGKTVVSHSPEVAISRSSNKMTETQRTWWTQMTQFPISATLEMKGLVRPTMLMTYLRVNALFFGQRHVSSGLYVITKEEDTVGSNGYKTKLTLQRVAGDEDYITKVKTQVTSTLPVGVSVTSSRVEADTDGYIAKASATVDAGVVDSVNGSTGYQGGANSESGTTGVNASAGTIDVDSVKKTIWSTFKKCGLTDAGAAGAMGNIMLESGMRPNRLEEKCRNSISNHGGPYYSDTQYTNAINTGAIDLEEFCIPLKKYGDPPSKIYSDGCHYGYGLCQWTTTSRKTGLYNRTVKQVPPISIDNTQAQASYIVSELNTSYSDVYDTLTTTNDIDTACYTFYKRFEGPPDTDTTYSDRLNYAQQFYNTFAGTT